MKNDIESGFSSEELLGLIEKAPVGIIYFSSDWLIKYYNENLLNFGIFDKEEGKVLIGKNLWDSKFVKKLKLNDELTGLSAGSFFEKEIKNIKTVDNTELSIIIKGASISESETLCKSGVCLLALGDINNPAIHRLQSSKMKHNKESTVW